MFLLAGTEKTLLVFSLYSLFFLCFLASESSAEDSEQEDETSVQDIDNNGKEESTIDHLTLNRNDLISKEEQNSSSLLEENKTHADLVIAKPVSKSPERLRKDIEGLSEDTDYEEEDEVTKKRKDVKKDSTDKSSKPPVKRGKRRWQYRGVFKNCITWQKGREGQEQRIPLHREQ